MQEKGDGPTDRTLALTPPRTDGCFRPFAKGRYPAISSLPGSIKEGQHRVEFIPSPRPPAMPASLRLPPLHRAVLKGRQRVELPRSQRISGTVGPGATGRLQPKTAFSRFPPVHRVDLEGRLRVEFTSSPSRPRPSAICAKPTAGVRRKAVVADRGGAHQRRHHVSEFASHSCDAGDQRLRLGRFKASSAGRRVD